MLDAVDRVLGRVPYTINLTAPLQAKVLRSPHAHARIVRVDTSRAARLPGVTACLSGADLLARDDVTPFFGPVFRDQPVLAIHRVRYVGEPVVAVAAADLDIAREALDLIDIEYEELPAAPDLDSALAPGAPILHPGDPLRARLFADVVVQRQPGTNICNTFRIRKGDIDEGFGLAEHVFTDTFTSPPVQQVPLETHACIASVQDGEITVIATTQTPYVLRAQMAEVFNCPASSIRVIVPTLGGGFGAKTYPSIEPLTAALALVARRPVKYHLTREEEFVTVSKHGMRIELTTGLTSDGRIVARRATCHFDTGAYANIGPRLISYGGAGTGGPYAIPHQWVDSYAVYTNTVPAGAFRGYGINQAAWAHETQMDMIAERLGMDPLELRRRNLIQDGDTFSTGDAVEDVHFTEVLNRAADWIGWQPSEDIRRDGTKVRAKGISVIACRSLPLAVSTALVKMADDGSVDVLTSSVEMGQGVRTAMAYVAADALSIDVSQVRVSTVDTAITPYDQQTSASRTTNAMGGAVRQAAEDIREQLHEIGAELLEINPTDLEARDGRLVVKGDPARGISYGDVVRKSRSGNLIGRGRHRTVGALNPDTGQSIGPGPGHWHQAAGAAEVEVDLETGKVEVLRYHAGIYAGRIVNPVQAELQTEGNVAFGIGQALFEEMVFDNGQLQNANLGEYMITSIKDLPRELHTDVVEGDDTAEIHGIGEPSLPPVMPAVGNAIFRATGVRITDLPVTPEKVLRALRAKANA
jgi:CO/xanthine dehydrogenase Mo-binding subunit